MSEEIKPEYQHYKGGMYVLEGIATHEETGESLAVYRPWNKPKCFLFARPASEFFGMVEVEEKKVPRFKLKDI